MGMSSKRKSIPVWGGDKPTHFRLLPSVVPKEPELVTRLQPRRGVQEEKRLWRPGPHPSCLSVTTKGQNSPSMSSHAVMLLSTSN